MVSLLLICSILCGCETLGTLTAEYVHDKYSTAAKAFEPDETMLTFDNSEVTVTWEEFYHWLYQSVVLYEEENGAVTDWGETLETGVSLQTYLLNQAVSGALEYAYIEAGAAGMGISVSANMEKSAREEMQKDAAYYDSYDEFISAIEAEYSTEEYYLYTKEMSLMYSVLYYTLYGEKGENLENEKIRQYVAEDGYLQAVQLQLNLFDSETGEDLEQAEKDKKLQLAEWAIKQLEVCETVEERTEKFNTIVLRYSEDVGSDERTEGILFTRGDKDTEYYDAVSALENFEYTDVLEINGCYYVLMRIPVNPDSVPIANTYYTSDSSYTLRYMASVWMYQDLVNSWHSEYAVQTTDAFKSIDLGELFAE